MAFGATAVAQIGTAHLANATAMRFAVLDSWRGICALMVALFHFPAANAISQSQFIRSSYLFVDFFFVLSGFVITARYANRLGETGDVTRFVLVRLGRIYPLHLFMMIAFVGFEFVRLMLAQLRSADVAPFTGGFGLDSLLTNLFLLQGIGFEHRLTWNGPSWSISAEFFTYMLFAGTMLAAGARAWIVFAIAVVAAPLLLLAAEVKTMDLSYDLGFVRCLYGFSAGALVAWFQHDSILAERRSPLFRQNRHYWTLAEAAMIAAIYICVCSAGDKQASIAAPLVFACALVLFAHEGGQISAILRWRPFLLLGALSYSVYMVHTFVQMQLYNVASQLERVFDVGLIGEILHHGKIVPGFGPLPGAVGALAMLAMVFMTVTAAYLTWRFVEMPALSWVQCWVSRNRAVAGRGLAA